MFQKTIKLVDRMLSKPFSARTQSIRIYKPIIIIGMERSGTTLLYSILSNHPYCYWLSRFDSLLPVAPFLCSLIRKVGHTVSSDVYVAILGTISKSRGLIPPSECLPYWKRLFKWGDENHYLIENDYFDEHDVEAEAKETLLEDLRKRLFYLGKKRLLFKQPGFSLKIRYLNAVFPDAFFIHIIRHPVDNLISLVNVKNESGQKFWGIKIPGWRDLMNIDKVEQATIQRKTVLDIVERDIQSIKELNRRYLMVRLEDLWKNLMILSEGYWDSVNLISQLRFTRHCLG